jgi:mercuric ion transport protein
MVTRVNRIMDIKAVAIGIKAGLLSSLCCVGALILVLLGIGTVSAALSLTQYRPYFVALGLIFMTASIWYHFKKSCKDETCCNLNKKQFIATVVAVYTIILVVLLYAVVPALAPVLFSSQPLETASASENVKQVTLSIESMTCSGCAEIVKNSLLKKRGILKAEVSYLKSSAVVWYDSSIIDKEEIVTAIPKPYIASLINE